MSLSRPFTPLHCLDTSRLDWSIKVRLLRMWKLRNLLDRQKISQIELILLDVECKKIQASIPSQCVDLFSHILCEGVVYNISFFHVRDNVDFCMNQFKLVFCLGTRIDESYSLAIPMYSLVLFHSEKILNYRNGLSYLIDAVGVITDIDVNPANDSGAVKVRLTDRRGSFVSILYGDYADEFKNDMLEHCSGITILLLKFVRIVCREGTVFVESVEHVSQIVLNPPLLEVDQFKIDMGYGGDVKSDILAKTEYYSSSKICKELEFNGLYPHKSLYEFVHTLEDGLFVLSATAVAVFRMNCWFYPVCHCGEFFEFGGGSYYCVRCHHTVFNCKTDRSLLIEFQDDTHDAIFPVAADLLEEIDALNDDGSSFVLSDNGEMVSLDKKVLVIVKKVRRVEESSDDDIEVVRLTDNVDLIKKFHLNETDFTPTKSIVEAFTGGSSLSRGVNVGKRPMVDDDVESAFNAGVSHYQKNYQEFKNRVRGVMFMDINDPCASSSKFI